MSKAQWAEGCRSVLKLSIPWFSLCPSLTVIEHDGRINYTRFLERYRIAMRSSDRGWMQAMTDTISARLFSAFHTLEESFRFLDEDKSGSLNLGELERGFEKMDIGLSRSQIFEIMRSLDSNCDGTISFAEFAARFRFTFEREAALSHHAGAPPPARDAWLDDALHSIGRAFARAGAVGATASQVAVDVFCKGDTGESGVLAPPAFACVRGRARERGAGILARGRTDTYRPPLPRQRAARQAGPLVHRGAGGEGVPLRGHPRARNG